MAGTLVREKACTNTYPALACSVFSNLPLNEATVLLLLRTRFGLAGEEGFKYVAIT